MSEAPSSWQVSRVMALAHQTLESLRVEHGQVFDDDESIMTALADEGVSVERIIQTLVRAALDARASAAAATQRLEDLKVRKDRYLRHEDAYRGTVTAVLQSLGLTGYKDPEFSLSLRPGQPKLHITDIEQLPAEMVEEITLRKPMTAEIKAALVRGETVEGAALGNAAAVLTILSK